MKRLIPFLVVLCASPTLAGTLSIQLAGFSALPAQAPANWPAGVVWPGGVAPNGTKQYTISDAELLRVLQWSEFAAIGNGLVMANAGPPDVNGVPTATPQTVTQVLLNFVQSWINGIKTGVQQYFTTAPVVPAAPVIN